MMADSTGPEGCYHVVTSCVAQFVSVFVDFLLEWLHSLHTTLREPVQRGADPIIFDVYSLSLLKLLIKVLQATVYVRIVVLLCARPFQNTDLRCKGAAALKLPTEASLSWMPAVG